MVLVAAVALGSSTYAWFVNNTKVTASTVSVTAQAANNLLITHGDGTNAAYNTTTTLTTAALGEIVPVSTIGANTSAGMTASFYKDDAWTTEIGENSQKGEYLANTFKAATPATDFYHDQVTMKASQASTLFLDQETVFTGLEAIQKTLRLALVVKGTGTPDYDGVYFYEVMNGENSNGSYNTSTVSYSADGIKKAVSGANTVATITGKNVSADTGIPTLSAMRVPTPTNNAMASGATTQAIYAFTGADDTVTVDIYVWMEGCDFDCNSTVVKEITKSGADDTTHTVTAVLGFCVGTVS